jgi:epoxyqueuosine reductase
MKQLPHISQELLKQLGVLDWGYTEEDRPQSWANYQQWTTSQNHSPLDYLSDERQAKRQDLKEVYPDFASALVFCFSYQEAKKWMLDNDHHEVAAYTLGFQGEDYHFALKRKLIVIFNEFKKYYPDLEHFIALDTQPVMERDLAFRAGLGWFGKNSMLINRKEGSYFIIGSLLLNKKLPIKSGLTDTDHCGQCTACIDACPTDAIDPRTRTLKADRCLSTFTIEIFKDAEAPKGHEKSRGEIFGCDICQDVCPWNKKPLLRTIGKLNLQESVSFLKEWFYVWKKEDFYTFISKQSNRGYRKLLKGTAFDRPGREGWLKNLKALLSRSSRSDL